MNWQIPLIAGLVGGIGIALLIAELVPRRPRLASALLRLGEPEIVVEAEQADFKTRVGTWGVRHLSERPGFKVPESDLRILGQSPVNYFYGKIIMLVLMAVLLPASFTVIAVLMGLPPMVPLVTLLLVVPLGVFAIVLADSTVTSKAKEAREEFARAMATYLELVALERRRGAITSVALEEAANVGEGWVFSMIGYSLRQAKIAGTQPWVALEDLSRSLDVPELRDVAHITQLAGEEGTSVYSTLRARATALRTKLLNEEHRTANQVSERMTYPQTLLGMVFIAILLTPPLLNMLS